MAEDIRPETAPFDGRWWSPDDPSHVIGGRLELEGGIWALKLFGWLGEWSDRNNNERPSVVHGQIGSTNVTLLELVPGGFRSSGTSAPFESKVSANVVILGAHGTEETKFTAASVRLLNLNEWAGRQPWRFGYHEDENHEITGSYKDPGLLEAELPGVKVSLGRSLSHSDDQFSTLTMVSNEVVHFQFGEALDLVTIEHDYVRPLQHLVGLAAASYSPVIELTLRPEGADRLAKWATVLSSASRERLPEPRQWFRFLFTLGSTTFETVVPAWWKLHEEIGVVADLIAPLPINGFVGNQFMNAASAIEGYHRHRTGRQKASQEHKARIKAIVDGAPQPDRAWLKEQLTHSHEPTFASRLDAVVEQAGPLFADAVGNVAAWGKWVKDGRNGVAHRDPGMIDVDAEWRTTIRILPTMQWLMRLVLLREIGIPDDVIASGVHQDRSLEFASQQLRELKPEWFA